MHPAAQKQQRHSTTHARFSDAADRPAVPGASSCVAPLSLCIHRHSRNSSNSISSDSRPPASAAWLTCWCCCCPCRRLALLPQLLIVNGQLSFCMYGASQLRRVVLRSTPQHLRGASTDKAAAARTTSSAVTTPVTTPVKDISSSTCRPPAARARQHSSRAVRQLSWVWNKAHHGVHAHVALMGTSCATEHFAELAACSQTT